MRPSTSTFTLTNGQGVSYGGFALPETTAQVRYYASGFERRGTIRNRVSIDERLKIAEQRVRIGDWEGNTVIGKNHMSVLVTLAERKSCYVLAGQLRSKHSKGVTEKVNSLLRLYKHKCHTVTFDNGKEFEEHETIALELETDIYFAYPYHSWEQGLNENSNGLLRQYFPKNMDLTDVTEEQVQWAVDRLNHRPESPRYFRRHVFLSQVASADSSCWR